MDFTEKDMFEWDKLRSILRQAVNRSKKTKASIARAIEVREDNFSNQVSGTRKSVMVLPTYSRALRECGIDLSTLLMVAVNDLEELPEAVTIVCEKFEYQKLATTEEKAAIIALARTGFFDKAKPEDVLAVWHQMVDARRT